MTYMFEVTVIRRFVGNGIQLPVGLSVHVPFELPYGVVSLPAGKKRIIEAFRMQCGIDLSGCPAAISSAYMKEVRD